MTKGSRVRHPLSGALKGTVRIAPGTDLTEPADPLWGMDLVRFEESLVDRAPPRELPPALLSLWWAKKGDWNKAHKIVMNEDSHDAAWVHAHLHRAEGDRGNAEYWYRQARKPVATGALGAEREAIVAALLERKGD